MNDDRDFEHHSSSNENLRVNLNDVLRRSQLFENRNHPKFVHSSLQSRLNFSQRNINEIQTPSIGLKFIQKFLSTERKINLVSKNSTKPKGRMTAKTQPSLKLIQKPALSSRPTDVDIFGDPNDEEMIELIISGIRDNSITFREIMNNVKELKLYMATCPIDS